MNRLWSVVVVCVVAVSCGGEPNQPDPLDAARTSEAAQDPIFGLLAAMWSPRFDSVAERPALPDPPWPDTSSRVSQLYDIERPESANAEAAKVVEALALAGWDQVSAGCSEERRSGSAVSGLRMIDEVEVLFNVVISENLDGPGLHATAEITLPTLPLAVDPIPLVSDYEADTSCLDGQPVS